MVVDFNGNDEMFNGMILYLLRHGESESNDKNIFAAKKIDLPLTEKGIRQAEAQARRLEKAGLEKIFTSPLRRAKQTAEIVGESCGLKPITMDCLCEVDVGVLDGKKMTEPHDWKIWVNMLQAWENGDADTAFPKGENLHDVKARFERFIEEIKGIEKPVLAVSHCAFFIAVLWSFCKNHGSKIEDCHMGRGCLSIVKKTGNNLYIEEFNIQPVIIQQNRPAPHATAGS